MEKLWEPVSVGDYALRNRLAMAPMTRSRATPDGVPTPLNATYYAQRAAFGLIITEGTQPSELGQGYMLTPGIYTDAQIEGWSLIADAVHHAGGRIFIQLMHVGRIAHPANTPRGLQPVAPSGVRPAGKMFTPQGLLDMPVPIEMDEQGVAQAIREFRHAARCAINAGADGVELHAANGYLIHQFLSENANRRTDRYGGSIGNRVRFAVEATAAVAKEIGAARTGIHISPGNPFNDIVEGDTAELYRTLVADLAKLNIAYLHVVHAGDESLLGSIRDAWPTALLVNRAGRPRDDIAADINSGLADMASVARFALANPDLVDRLKRAALLNEPDPSTFYGGDARGYTDYPTLDSKTADAR